MRGSFSRAAFSPVIAEANDRSDGIYSAVDGSLIAQGSQGLPVFVGVMQYSTKTVIEMIGDATIAYLSGQIDAGVDAVQLFDSWAGVLPEAEFER